jgi:type II secretory pathway component PulK
MIIRAKRQARRGVILLAVLVVVAILTLIAYRFFNLMNAEYEATHATNRVTQSRYMADSGLHYAAFVLSYPQNVGLSDAPDESSNLIFPGFIYDNPSVFHYRPVTSRGAPGFFSIVAPRTPDDPDLNSARPFRFGVEDEGGKINLNAILKMDRTGQKAKDLLTKLPNVTSDMADSIITWMQAAGVGTSSNSDSQFYSTQGYTTKNGPYETLEELLLVKGMTPKILFGNDLNRNGVLDADEDDGSGQVDRGLSRLLTVYSRERNFDSTGNQRVWINDTDLSNLETNLQNAGLDEELVNFILVYRMYGPVQNATTVRVTAVTAMGGSAGGSRGTTAARTSGPGGASTSLTGGGSNGTFAVTIQTATPAGGSNPVPTALKRENIDTSSVQSGQLHKISSLYELIDAKVNGPSSGQGQSGGQGQPASGGSNQQQTPQYSSPLKKADLDTLRDLLPQLLDKASTSQQLELAPRINVNTAPSEVLQALPNLTAADVQNILDHRPNQDTDPSQGPLYRTTAWLITEAGFEASVVQQLDPYITAHSQVYRMQVIGYYELGGPSVRVEAVIDTNNGRPKFLYWRDLTELGRGYDMRNIGQ